MLSIIIGCNMKMRNSEERRYRVLAEKTEFPKKSWSRNIKDPIYIMPGNCDFNLQAIMSYEVSKQETDHRQV